MLDALRFKCGVLWSQLDALHFAYVAPGVIPPGAFVPDVLRDGRGHVHSQLRARRSHAGG